MILAVIILAVYRVPCCGQPQNHTARFLRAGTRFVKSKTCCSVRFRPGVSRAGLHDHRHPKDGGTFHIMYSAIFGFAVGAVMELAGAYERLCSRYCCGRVDPAPKSDPRVRRAHAGRSAWLVR